MPARAVPAVSPESSRQAREPDEPMRVLFLTPYYKPYLGGIERAIEELGAALMKQGHRVGVLTTAFAFPRRHMPGLPVRETIDGGVEIYRLPAWPRRAPPVFSVPLVWFPPAAIGRVVRDFQPDVIHWVGDGWFWGHFWAWLYGRDHAGLVFTPSFHALRPAYRWLQPINILLSRAADRVTTLSEVESRALARTYLVPADRVTQIGWGVASPTDAPTRPRREPGEPLTILCVGRLGNHKGQAWLLDRVLGVRDRVPRPVRLVFIGRDEDGGGALRDRVRRERLEDLVLLTGEVDDATLHRWYSRSDLFALFSRYEARGLAYLEAMAHGLPVLTHDVGATRETAREGAIVVPAYDDQAAEDALLDLLSDDAKRAQLGAAARAWAARFSWEDVAARFLAVYRSARSGKAPWPDRKGPRDISTGSSAPRTA